MCVCVCMCVCMCVCVCAVSILKGTQLSGAVSEAAGVVEGFITIVRVGESEVPISFRLAVDAGTVSAVKGIYPSIQQTCFYIA